MKQAIYLTLNGLFLILNYSLAMAVPSPVQQPDSPCDPVMMGACCIKNPAWTGVGSANNEFINLVCPRDGSGNVYICNTGPNPITDDFGHTANPGECFHHADSAQCGQGQPVANEACYCPDGRDAGRGKPLGYPSGCMVGNCQHHNDPLNGNPVPQEGPPPIICPSGSPPTCVNTSCSCKYCNNNYKEAHEWVCPDRPPPSPTVPPLTVAPGAAVLRPVYITPAPIPIATFTP